LSACATTLKAWALEHAFPIWWDVGADKVQGGFFEKIALDGTPVEAPRRARVQPRQIYSYAVAGLLGWDGPWKQALEHGLDFYLSKYRRPDGFMRTLVASDGSPLDDKVDLYDQAFGLFGLAMASSVLPERADLPALAVNLREALYATLKHPGRRLRGDQSRAPCRCCPTRTCTCSRPAWPGSRPAATPNGGPWPTRSPNWP
jgi:mannose/cellobiose epimerase-like protein (N-acyl-D-glucosamine 2-epimerase family)